MSEPPLKPFSYRVLPETFSGNTKSVSVEKSHFSDISRKQQVLIIGFDTEYQTREGETDNQVISYQFSAEILDVDESRSGVEWSGIILPNSLEVFDRLTIADFLSVVVSEGVEQYPDIVIPKNLYLFAHFSRADLPAFAEFKDDKQRRTLKLDNIRSSFVNGFKDLRCGIDDTDTGETIELHLLIRDTMHLAAGGKSLEAIGDVLGIEKVKLVFRPKRMIPIGWI